MNRTFFNNMIAQYFTETITGRGSVEWTDGVHCWVPSLKVYGICEQSSTPSPENPVEIEVNTGKYRFTDARGVSNTIYETPLYSVGEYRDEFDYVTGVGCQYIVKVELDGVSDYKKVTWVSSEGRCDVVAKYVPIRGTAGVLCSHFPARQTNEAGFIYTRINSSTGNYEICFTVGEDTEMSVSECNNWLAEQYSNGTPVTIYYALAQPFGLGQTGTDFLNIADEYGRFEYCGDNSVKPIIELKCVKHSMWSDFKKIPIKTLNQVIEWSGGVHCHLPSLKFYGACSQYPTPTPDNPVDIYDHIGVYKVNSSQDYIGLPNLRGIGDYKDEWDYVTGKGARRVASVTLDGVSDGKKVLGVGLATKTGYYYGVIQIEHKSHHAQFGLLLSSHFRPEWTFTPGTAYVSGSGSYEFRQILIYHTDQTLDTVDKWNAWLKAQYDAGTPVIFYYALAEPLPFEERPQTYQPIPNDSGQIQFVDGNVSGAPFEVTYIVNSRSNLLNITGREIVNFGAAANTTLRSFTGKGIFVGIAYNNYYYSGNILQFEQYDDGFEYTRNNQSAYGIGFDLRLLPNTTYICAFDELESRSDKAIVLAEYDGNGNWLRTVYPDSSSFTEKVRRFVTSADAVWGVFTFQNPEKEKAFRYSNVSIRKE